MVNTRLSCACYFSEMVTCFQSVIDHHSISARLHPVYSSLGRLLCADATIVGAPFCNLRSPWAPDQVLGDQARRLDPGLDRHYRGPGRQRGEQAHGTLRSRSSQVAPKLKPGALPRLCRLVRSAAASPSRVHPSRRPMEQKVRALVEVPLGLSGQMSIAVPGRRHGRASGLPLLPFPAGPRPCRSIPAAPRRCRR